MNGTNFLVDTNIIIYLTRERLNTSDFAKKGSNLYISSINYIEALGYTFQNQSDENAVINICESFERLFLTKEIEKQTILIRKSNKIKLPDAIIAATAIVHNLTLITNNTDDFKNIQGLKMINPL
jgi:predicted nucleic acid-binding protein